MNTLPVLFSVLVALTLASASPVSPPSRPQRHEILLTMRRPVNIKSRVNTMTDNFEEYPPSPPSPPLRSLRKGEYVCGDRVCKLQPGEVPPGCNGLCQHRV